MKKQVGLILLGLVLMTSIQATAQTWVSVSLPNSYQFSGEESATISGNPVMGGTLSDYMIHASLPYLPPIGYERYKILIEDDTSDETTAIIDVEFYDICLDFEQKLTRFVIGVGYGSMKTDCETTSCSGIKFKKGIARQYFGQVGVLLFGRTFFQIGVHRVMGENKAVSGSGKEQIVLDGMLVAGGIKIGW